MSLTYVLACHDRRRRHEEEPARLTPNGAWTVLSRSDIIREARGFASAMDALCYLDANSSPTKHRHLEEYDTVTGDLIRFVSI